MSQQQYSSPCCEFFPFFVHSVGCEDHWPEGGVVLWSPVHRQRWVHHMVEAEQEGVRTPAVSTSIHTVGVRGIQVMRLSDIQCVSEVFPSAGDGARRGQGGKRCSHSFQVSSEVFPRRCCRGAHSGCHSGLHPEHTQSLSVTHSVVE